VWVIVAVVIVLANRRSMLAREGAVIEVIMPEEGSPDDARMTANS
jgi:hypothetical protein